MRSILAALMVFSLMLAEVRANLVVNGDFTDGVNGLGGWTLAGNNPGGPGFLFGDFTGNNQWTLSQSLATTPGTEYELSFTLSGWSHAVTPFISPLTLNFGGFSDQLTFANFTPGAVVGGQTNSWSMPLLSYEFFVTPASSGSLLSFTTSEDLNTWDLVLNNVSVEAVPDQSSTATLLILAGCGFLLVRRWRRETI